MDVTDVFGIRVDFVILLFMFSRMFLMIFMI